MFDTVGGRCFTKEHLKWQNLAFVKEERDTKTGLITLRGNLNNLQVKEIPEGYKVFGSLPKYFFGNNLEVLSRKSTMQAIEKLSDDLGINISESKLFRFDVSCNLIMLNEVKHYINLLDDLSRFRKSQYRESLYYSTDKIELIFYNKTLEMSRKRQAIPEHFKQYKNRILRYEMRYLRGIKHYFKRDINLHDLSNESFYIELIKQWKEYYFQINKKGKLKFNDMALTDVKNFQNQLMLQGLIALGGFDEVVNMIELSRNDIGRHKVKRIKDKIKALKKSKELIEVNPLIKELDTRIKNANNHYR